MWAPSPGCSANPTTLLPSPAALQGPHQQGHRHLGNAASTQTIYKFKANSFFFFFGRRKPFRIKFGILTGEKQPAPGTDPAALQDAFNPNLQPKGVVLGSPAVHVEAFEFKPLLPCHIKAVWYLDVDLSHGLS